MSSLKRRFFILFSVLHIATTERRITGGKELHEKKRYMVYFVRAPSSPRAYDAWLCGGSLVSDQYIVTSAACVEDVQHMYAIAGYQKHVPTQELDQDECTKAVKKKVVYTCVPKAYEFDFAKIEKWAYIDIAVAKVESPYNFGDSVWEKKCSYAPRPIRINYEKKYQKPGVDTMVFGWGHLDIWRLPQDTKDYNQRKLHYASTLIYDTEKCKKFFQEIGPMAHIIEKYMICTLDSGNIDEKGDPISTPKTLVDGCTPSISRMLKGELVCEEDDFSTPSASRPTLSHVLARQQSMTRRQGICQNDHGGPLITWVGGHEVLIGVASVFRLTEGYQCTGPFLFTSTHCNGLFLDCVINGKEPGNGRSYEKKKSDLKKDPDEPHNSGEIDPYSAPGFYTDILEGEDKTRRYELCDKPPAERGFDKLEKHISWMKQPEGPAENEILMIRPQIPLYRRNIQNGSEETTNL